MKRKVFSLLIILLICIFSFPGCGTEKSDPGGEAQTAAPVSQITDNARVSYLGPAGTYTEEAAQFFFPTAGELLPEETVALAIADIASGIADYAVIPQENTLGGAVTNHNKD